MITWHYLTSAAYNAADAASKTNDKLFFLSDTKQIFRGTQNFSEACELFTGTLPTAYALGKIYINSATLEGKMHDGTAWRTVIQPVVTGATGDEFDATNTDRPVSGKAVADYIADQLGDADDIVSDLDWNSTTKVITATMLDGTTTDTITLEGLGCDMSFEAISGDDTKKALKLKDVSGNVLATVNLDLERFVTHAEYNHTTRKIILCFDEGEWVDPEDHSKGKTYSDKIEIDVGDLVDTYTAGADTSTAHVDVTNNQITASVRVSSDADNAITVEADGIKVDISGKANLAVPAAAHNLAGLTATGDLEDSGKKAGGATITYDAQQAASANTLATEAAVEAIRAALQLNIDGKIAKMTAGDAGKIVVSTADGQVDRSTMVLGGATFTDVTADKAVTVPTQAGVEGYALAKSELVKVATIHDSSAAATDDNPVSEKALLASLEWKTTV